MSEISWPDFEKVELSAQWGSLRLAYDASFLKFKHRVCPN